MMKITCWAPPPAAALYLRALPVTSHSHPVEKKILILWKKILILWKKILILWKSSDSFSWESFNCCSLMRSSQQSWSLKIISVVSAFCGPLRTIHITHNIWKAHVTKCKHWTCEVDKYFMSELDEGFDRMTSCSASLLCNCEEEIGNRHWIFTRTYQM